MEHQKRTTMLEIVPMLMISDNQPYYWYTMTWKKQIMPDSPNPIGYNMYIVY